MIALQAVQELPMLRLCYRAILLCWFTCWSHVAAAETSLDKDQLLQGHGVAPHAAGIGKGAQRPPLHIEHHPRIGRVEWRRRENAIQRQ